MLELDSILCTNKMTYVMERYPEYGQLVSTFNTLFDSSRMVLNCFWKNQNVVGLLANNYNKKMELDRVLESLVSSGLLVNSTDIRPLVFKLKHLVSVDFEYNLMDQKSEAVVLTFCTWDKLTYDIQNLLGPTLGAKIGMVVGLDRIKTFRLKFKNKRSSYILGNTERDFSLFPILNQEYQTHSQNWMRYPLFEFDDQGNLVNIQITEQVLAEDVDLPVDHQFVDMVFRHKNIAADQTMTTEVMFGG